MIVLALAGLVHVPYDPVLLLGVLGLQLLIAFTVTAFGVMVAITIKRAADLHQRGADARDADDLPVRRAVPRLGPADRGSACSTV